jgi:hypothetical protein
MRPLSAPPPLNTPKPEKSQEKYNLTVEIEIAPEFWLSRSLRGLSGSALMFEG